MYSTNSEGKSVVVVAEKFIRIYDFNIKKCIY